tara:strand:+ start:2711 stop:3589 length:879 start_codon:yes stop_codon:yes gene_type:complete
MSAKKIASECGTEFFAKNSIAGFRNCLAIGVDGVEFDVHLTADNKVVVQHDDKLNKNITRHSNGEWIAKSGPALCDMTSAQLAEYDIGRYRPESTEAKSYPNYQALDGAPIPHLSDFVNLLSESGQPIELWIELKTSPFNRSTSSDPEKLLDEVLNQVESNNLTRQTVLLAFEWDLLVLAKQRVPDIQTNFLTINETTLQQLMRRHGEVDPGLLYGQFHPKDFGNCFATAIANAGGDYWGPWIQDVAKKDVDHARKVGVLTNLWGVEGNKSALDAAKALGADAITTSNPTLI